MEKGNFLGINCKVRAYDLHNNPKVQTVDASESQDTMTTE